MFRNARRSSLPLKWSQRLRRRWHAYRRLRTGRRGEALACRFLKKQGFFIWKRNWRCRHGELDIIAYRDKRLRFIEVKTRARRSSEAFPVLDAVTREKLYRLERLARIFTLRHRKPMRVRRLKTWSLDALTVIIESPFWRAPIISYYENISEGFRFKAPEQ